MGSPLFLCPQLNVFCRDENPYAAGLLAQVAGENFFPAADASVELLAVFVGRDAHFFLEDTVEMLRILEAQFPGNFAYGLVGSRYLLLGHVDQLVSDVFRGRLPRYLLDKVAEIVGR